MIIWYIWLIPRNFEIKFFKLQQFNEIYEKRYFDAIQVTKKWRTSSPKIRKVEMKKACKQATKEWGMCEKKTLKKSKGKYFLVQTEQTMLNKEFITLLLVSFLFCF